MIAGYLSDVSEPVLRAPDTVVGAESGPDGSTHTLGSRAALSGTSSLTFPGFVLNRALPGAVVAAIVFAVPGLSLEHLQSSGKTVTGPVTIDLQSLRRASSEPSTATASRARQDGQPADEIAYARPTAPLVPVQSNARASASETSRDQALIVSPASVGPVNSLPGPKPQSDTDRTLAQPGNLTPNGSAENGGLQPASVRVPEPARSLNLPEVAQGVPSIDSDIASAPVRMLGSEAVLPVMAELAFSPGAMDALVEQDGTMALPRQDGSELTIGSQAAVIDAPRNASTAPAAAATNMGPTDLRGRKPSRLAELASVESQPAQRRSEAISDQVEGSSRAAVTPPSAPEMSGEPSLAPSRLAALSTSAQPVREASQKAKPHDSDFVPRLKGRTFATGQGTSMPSAVAIASQLTTRIDGRVAGEIDFQQDMRSITVRIGSIVELLGDRYDTAELKRLTQSAAGNTYLSLAQLQQVGIPISYDPVYDEFNIGSKDYLPTAAHKVQMDQISRPQREVGPIVMEQLRR